MGAADETSTYSQVLQAIKTSDDGASVRELCELLELSPMSVRRQLSMLEAEGSLYAKKVKLRTGRPVFRYYLTREGHNKFPRDYAGTAIDLLVHLRDLDGKEKVAGLFESAANSQIAEFARRVLGNTLEARVHEVTELLKEKGYMAKWEKLGPDRYLIKEMNCAIEGIARKFPQACLAEERVLSELLRAKVSRRAHILRKQHFCSYLVEG